MLGHTLIVSCFDTDEKYPTNHKVWITEERTVDLLGMNFFHLFLKAFYIDIPAVQLKFEDGVISYGLLNNDEDYPNVSKIETIRLKDPHPISHRSSHLYKHTAETNFKKRATFFPQNQQDHSVTMNKGVLVYAVTDIQGEEKV